MSEIRETLTNTNSDQHVYMHARLTLRFCVFFQIAECHFLTQQGFKEENIKLRSCYFQVLDTNRKNQENKATAEKTPVYSSHLRHVVGRILNL